MRGAWTLGTSASVGFMNQEYLANERGTMGMAFADNELQAATVRFFAEQTIWLNDQVTFTVGGQGVAAPRDIDDVFSTPGQRPRYMAPMDAYTSLESAPTDFNKTYWGFNPTAGLRYEIRPAFSIFGNVGRSFEPPTFNTLLSPSGGTPNAGPSAFRTHDLKAQRATTAEVGSRRAEGQLQWDLVAYRTWIQDELLTTSAIFGGSGVTQNSPVRTIHQGLEAQIHVRLAEQMLSAPASSDRLTLWTTYNLSDFFFDTDERNQIAGVPRHLLHARLVYEHPAGLVVEPKFTWTPQRTPTDHANTVHQDPYVLWGGRISYEVPLNWFGGGALTVFGEAENLGDVAYASSYLIRDRVPDPAPPALSPAEVATFIPGQGRSVRLGVTVGW